MSLLEVVHERYVTGRRVRVLADHLADAIPEASAVLDVGSGDGRVAAALLRRRPDLHIEGLEVQVRSDACLRASTFDGRSIPQADGSHDVALFVDVLHHAAEPLQLLLEGCRVARRAVVIKDHVCEGWLATQTLRFMDRVSNTRHGVPIPAVYWSHQEWLEAFANTSWVVQRWQPRLRLYPAPASWIFERSLHFIACLERTALLASATPACPPVPPTLRHLPTVTGPS